MRGSILANRLLLPDEAVTLHLRLATHPQIAISLHIAALTMLLLYAHIVLFVYTIL